MYEIHDGEKVILYYLLHIARYTIRASNQSRLYAARNKHYSHPPESKEKRNKGMK
jgi:hypothetical protein